MVRLVLYSASGSITRFHRGHDLRATTRPRNCSRLRPRRYIRKAEIKRITNVNIELGLDCLGLYSTLYFHLRPSSSLYVLNQVLIFPPSWLGRQKGCIRKCLPEYPESPPRSALLSI